MDEYRKMIKFIIKRMLIAIPTMLTIIFLVFLLVHATPGNPFQGERALSPEVIKQLLHQYRLDLPLWKQFILYVNDLLHGDFGLSYKFLGQSINALIFPDYVGVFYIPNEKSRIDITNQNPTPHWKEIS